MRLRPPALDHHATPRDNPSLRISAWLSLALRPRSRAAALALLLVVAAGTGCSTPRTASGTLDEGKQRIVQLVLDAAHALPATVRFDPPTKVGAQPCRKTVAGYVVGKTGAHRAEVPLIVYVPPGTSRHLLDVIGAAWTRAGYELNPARVNESGFPQLRARTPEGDEVVATAFTRSAEQSQIDLYAVTQCLRGS